MRIPRGQLPSDTVHFGVLGNGTEILPYSLVDDLDVTAALAPRTPGTLLTEVLGVEVEAGQQGFSGVVGLDGPYVIGHQIGSKTGKEDPMNLGTKSTQAFFSAQMHLNQLE